MSGNAISSTAFNTLETDIGTEITNSLDRGGRAAMTSALPMGSNKITGMADPTVATDGATKNYVDTSVSAFFSTGDGKITFKTIADAGWILCDDGTFGSAASLASTRANADTQLLFNLFFTNLTDANAPLLTAGGGATTRAAQTSASNAWAANCRMTIPKTLGRAIAIAGTGAGLTARALGVALGEENHALVAGEIPALTSTNSGFSITSTSNAAFYQTDIAPATVGVTLGGSNYKVVPFNANTGSNNVQSFGSTGAFSVNSSGTNGTAHNTMQPTSFWNVMVKL